MKRAAIAACVLVTDCVFADDTTCGRAEIGIFQFWSLVASAADRGDALHVPNVESRTVIARDGIKLKGFRMKTSGGTAKGALLVIQGNTTLANRLVPALEPLRALGVDVYIFDFRGFGRSEGTRRLRLMLTDYQQISSDLRSQGYKHFIVYAYSFGGTLALDALGDGAHFDALILDSTRSRIRDFGCPVEFDPVEHLPRTCSNVLIITGSADPVIPTAEMAELVTTGERRGAQTVRGKGWGHPFQERDGGPRMKVLKQFVEKVAQN